MNVSIDNGIVTITITVPEANALRRALNDAGIQQHQDYQFWVVTLRENWDAIATRQGNTWTIIVDEEDAKQLQDLTGQMREEANSAWETSLEEFDNKLHNLWLRPADHFPRS